MQAGLDLSVGEADNQESGVIVGMIQPGPKVVGPDRVDALRAA